VFLAAGTCLLVMFIQILGYIVRTAAHKVVERSTLVKYGQVCILCPFLICCRFFFTSSIYRLGMMQITVILMSISFEMLGLSSPCAGKLLGGNDVSQVGKFGDNKYVLRHYSSCWNLHRLTLYGLDDRWLCPGERIEKMM
jgi:hypothetical protein